MRILTCLWALPALLMGIVYADDPLAEQIQKARTAAHSAYYDLVGQQGIELTFDSGVAAINSEHRTRLEGFIRAQKSDAHLLELVVASWGDHSTADGKVDPIAEASLADHRTEEVERVLSTMDSELVVSASYNMAKEPNALEDLLYTREVKIKEYLRGEALPATDESLLMEAQILRQLGGERRVVILARSK